MPDNDLLDRFEAILPRFKLYSTSQVPAAGSRELAEYREDGYQRRMDVLVRGIVAVVLGLMAAVGHPTFMAWLTLVCVVAAVSLGITSADRYLQLAFGRRAEEALPPGTDIHTARLEDGILGLMRQWNSDAFSWNRRVDDLWAEFIEWQLLIDLPETRGLEWSEAGSKTRGLALIAAVRGFSEERSALMTRRELIDRRLRNLDDRLLMLKASESRPIQALPAPKESEDTDDG